MQEEVDAVFVVVRRLVRRAGQFGLRGESVDPGDDFWGQKIHDELSPRLRALMLAVPAEVLSDKKVMDALVRDAMRKVGRAGAAARRGLVSSPLKQFVEKHPYTRSEWSAKHAIGDFEKLSGVTKVQGAGGVTTYRFEEGRLKGSYALDSVRDALRDQFKKRARATRP